MHERIEVIYENGVLRPLGRPPCGLHESERYYRHCREGRGQGYPARHRLHGGSGA